MAYAAEIDREKALQAGFQTHLTKPLEPERFISEIIALLKRKEAIAFQIKTEVNWCCEFCGRASIRPGESVEEFCDRICTTDNANKYPVVAYFRAFPRRWLMTVAYLNHGRQKNLALLISGMNLFSKA